MSALIPPAKLSVKIVRGNLHMAQTQSLFGVLVLLGLAWTYLFNPADKPFGTLVLASSVILLGFWPLYRWVGDPRRDAIPVLQLHAAFYAVSFGVAGLLPPGRVFNLDWTSEGNRQLALLMAGLGLLSLFLGYRIARGPSKIIKPTDLWPLIIMPGAYLKLVLIIIPIVIILNKVIVFLGLSVLSQIADAIYSFLFIAAIHAALSGAMPWLARRVVFFGLIPYQIIFGSGLADGAISGVFNWAIVIGLTYASTRRRVPYQWILLAVGIFFLLQPIKGEFRTLTWGGQVNWSTLERIQVWTEMGLSYYLSDESLQGQQVEGLNESFNRINHLMVTAAVIADTPSRQPFLYGESYIPLLSKWIPRFIWSDKPLENFGNIWARKYGYLAVNDFNTSFNLPWLSEMYINFGALGVFGVSLLLGIVFRYLSVRFWFRPTNASAYAFGMVIGMQLSFVESNLSLLLGQLIISAFSLTMVGYMAAIFLPKYFIWRSRAK